MTDYGKRAEAKISVHAFDLDSWEVLLREAQVQTQGNGNKVMRY